MTINDPTPTEVVLLTKISELKQQLAASEKMYQQERDQRIACGEHNAELEGDCDDWSNLASAAIAEKAMLRAERDEGHRQLAECRDLVLVFENYLAGSTVLRQSAGLHNILNAMKAALSAKGEA